MRLVTLLIAVSLAGCASSEKKLAEQQKLDLARANTRAVEQMRMRAVTSGATLRERVAQVLVPDKEKEFDPAAARFGKPAQFHGKPQKTNEFLFVNRTRTKDFQTNSFATKGAWMGDAKFETKEAPTKESWFSRMTARTKGYDTKDAREAGKSVPVRALPGGDRAYVAQGRRQAELDATGKDKIPFGTTDMGPSWSGELKPLTIQDVKNLLNKN
jgi:uncharacterized protein YceK